MYWAVKWLVNYHPIKTKSLFVSRIINLQDQLSSVMMFQYRILYLQLEAVHIVTGATKVVEIDKLYKELWCLKLLEKNCFLIL